MKTCSRCHKDKLLDEFSKHNSTKDRRQKICKPCARTQLQEYRTRRHQAGQPSYSQNTRRRLRQEVLQHYSGGTPHCACCREMTYEFLAIDHLDGNGRRHREALSNGVYQWLKRNKFPPGFRVLCHNCNQAIGAYGSCPHQRTFPSPTTSLSS